MRRPIRPFTVEKKRGSRPTPIRDPGGEQRAAAMPQALPEPPAPGGGANWAAAEALFRGGGQRKPDATGRILQSLVEPPPQPVEEPAPTRRGRKPGSRNKPKTPQEPKASLLVSEEMAPDMEETQGSDWTDPAPHTPAAAIILRRRGRVSREDLPRGERWKARLPRFAR